MTDTTPTQVRMEIETSAPVPFEVRLNHVRDALNLENKAWRDAAGAQTLVAPDEYVGNLSKDILIDPVIAKDGATYERACITIYLSFHTHFPNSSIPVSNEFEPNVELRKKILEWRHQHVTSFWDRNPLDKA